jgi:1-acyl-sn-glycerol-3-phosphate acyltransferase
MKGCLPRRQPFFIAVISEKKFESSDGNLLFYIFTSMRSIYYFFFIRLGGWKIQGDVPRDLKKYIIAVAPHSSNWDFPIGLAVRSIKRFKSNFLGKKELFKAPFGWLFRKLGGYPVDRSHKTNLVDQVVEIIRTNEHFVIAIAPEGTRKKVDKWKSGFYYIAHKAEIPIVFASFDYPSKTVEFRPPFYPTGDLEKDSKVIMEFFEGKKGKNRNVCPIV